MKGVRFFSFFVFALLMASCQNYSFVKTGTAQHLAPRDADCPIIVFTSLEPDMAYTEIGICIATSPDFMMMDNTDGAIEEIKACACENGGNAVFIESIDREMDLEGVYNTRVTATLLIVEEAKK